MKILFVGKNYATVSGGEMQLRMFAQELSARHQVEVIEWPEIPEAYRNAVVRGSERLQLPMLLAAVGRFWRREPARSYFDNLVSVLAMGASRLDRLRISLSGSAKEPHYDERLANPNYRTLRSIFLRHLQQRIRGHDVVHAMTANRLGWIAEEAARAEGVPFVLTPFVHPDKTHLLASRAAFCRQADIAFALLESDAKNLIELGVKAERVRLLGVAPILPASVNPIGFRARHGLEGSQFVLYVGRMVPTKGAGSLLKAAYKVWERLPETRFIFAGTASEREKKIFEGHDPRIQYLGMVTEQEKGDAMAACDLFCMPSTSEILPTVYLEAWSYGRAVIGGTAHGLPELIEGNGAGVSVEQEPTLVAEQIVALLSDEPRRRQMGARGAEFVKRRCSRENLVRVLELAYEDAIQTRR